MYKNDIIKKGGKSLPFYYSQNGLYGLTTTFRDGRSPIFTIYTIAAVTGISTDACLTTLINKMFFLLVEKFVYFCKLKTLLS